MLQQTHYYHRIIRKLVVSFGSLFNDMRLVRYDQTTNSDIEIERITVPLMYASKEKFYMRINNSPDFVNPMNLTLPRMAFEMNGISYDPLRKISNFSDQFAEGLPLGLKKVKYTPYNFDFNLYVFVRNTEDGAQIVEQILPYFTPDYTVTLDFVGINDMKLDVPIVFNSITYDDSHEGDPESTRSIIWTLNFTAKGYLFGPVGDIRPIRKVTANVFDATFETNPLRDLILVPSVANTDCGTYKYDELVYQGRDVSEATATAYVKKWNPSRNVTNLLVGTANAVGNVVTANTLVIIGNVFVGNVITMNSQTRLVTNVNATAFVVNTNFTNANVDGTILRSGVYVANTIVVYDTNGTFRDNVVLVGASSGARYNVSSTNTDPNQLVRITVQPDPLTANTIDEAFGFSTNITEYV